MENLFESFHDRMSELCYEDGTSDDAMVLCGSACDHPLTIRQLERLEERTAPDADNAWWRSLTKDAGGEASRLTIRKNLRTMVNNLYKGINPT